MLRLRPARPHVQQMGPDECGPACLAMVLQHFGKQVKLREVRQLIGPMSGNVSVLIEAARRYGLTARKAQYVPDIELKEVDEQAPNEGHADAAEFFKPGSILHFDPRGHNWGHFVVFWRVGRRGVEIGDPGEPGPIWITNEEFLKRFSGVVLEFEPTKDFVPSSGEKPRLWPYLRQLVVKSGLMPRILVTSLLMQVFGLALPLFTKTLIDRGGGDQHFLTVIGVGLLGLVVFNFLSSLIRSHLLLHLRTQLDVQMTTSFVEHLMRLPFAFFQRRTTGDLIMRLNSNATIREVATSGVIAGLLDGSLVILYLIIIFATSGLMTLIVLVLAGVQAGLYVFAYRRYREVMTRELKAQAEVQGYEVEMLAGIESLKSAGAEHRAAEAWCNRFVDVLNVTLARGRLSAWVDSILGAMRMASPLLVLWAGAFLVLKGEMTLGTMFAVNALAGGLLVPFSGLVSTALQFTTLRSYVERVEDVLEENPEQEAEGKVRDQTLRGRISLEGVFFRYGQATPMVVRDASVDIQPGQRVAIVGRSGSGKSTLARLLVGLYAPTEGRILYDGLDLAQLDYQSVRKQFGFVAQNPYIFGDTIHNNIALTDPGLSSEAVERAARLAHIHDDIMAIPGGYEAMLAEGGMSLSGGQRQRIALARAIAHRPKVLVLDEATSDLDTVTESAIQKELESLSSTVVVIAHRLSTVVRADLILVMEAGGIIERGTHAELLSQNGYYSRLVVAQTRLDQTATGSTSDGHSRLTVGVVGRGRVRSDPPEGVHALGTVVRLLAEAVPGWRFERWAGDLATNTNPAILRMDRAKAVVAVFSEAP